jgi:hypothetical protein
MVLQAMVYAMQFAGKPGFVKLGYSNNVERRARELAAVHGSPTIIACIPGDVEEETKVKRRFRGQRVAGTEFFRVCRELESWCGRPLT